MEIIAGSNPNAKPPNPWQMMAQMEAAESRQHSLWLFSDYHDDGCLTLSCVCGWGTSMGHEPDVDDIVAASAAHCREPEAQNPCWYPEASPL